jgi:hypothetical protein
VGLEISYGGSGPTMDPTIIEEMLRLIDAGINEPAMAPDVSREFVASVERMRAHVGWERLPVARDAQGRHCYFTFGGRVLNGVIARWFGLGPHEAGEVVLRTEQSLDFSGRPARA